MSPVLLLTFVLLYFLLLLGVAWYTGRNANNESFFIGNRNSNWMLVAFGMIGTSLSGVTFVSVPGQVGFQGFSYFQIVIGYFLGYFVVAYVLLPLYYRMQLTSIYSYLNNRFGLTTYKTGALFFILSRTLGATARLYLVINVLQVFFLEDLFAKAGILSNLSFAISTAIILLMILLYTYKGGVKTIVFTDTLQTTFMLAGLITCVVFIMHQLHFSFGDSINALQEKNYLHIFNTNPLSAGFFLKAILGGAFITISMTGLDQEMMQKNISVSRLKDSQKNMLTLSVLQGVVVFIFLMLGGLLYVYALDKGGQFTTDIVNGVSKTQFSLNGVITKPDNVFPEIALRFLPPFIGVIFIIGLISALFPSADGALTSLTSSFCIDILGINRTHKTEGQKDKQRKTVHIVFTFVFLLCILAFKWFNNPSIIDIIILVAGYTYGPLLGLFSFGILTHRTLPKGWPVVIICMLAPVLCYIISTHAKAWFGGFEIGADLLIYNGLFTFLGLLLVSKKEAAMPALQTLSA